MIKLSWRNFISVTVVFIPIILIYGSTLASERVALVIGNSDYKHTGELTNPANDAADMKAALSQIGFEVVSGLNLDKSGMDRTVQTFAEKLASAEVGLFFYAGHGLQVDGVNYLVPVDAKLETSYALDFEMVRLDVVQRVMERATNTNVIFLDACRNNPLSRNLARALGTRSASIGRGLAHVESGIGTLISYATQPGNVALDGTGRNSPFTAALKHRIKTKGEDLTSVLIDVRNDVRVATKGKQVPWDQHALTARLFLNSQQSSAPPTVVNQKHSNQAGRVWANIQNITSVAILESYINEYPSSIYAKFAKARLGELTKISNSNRAAPSKKSNRATPPKKSKQAALPIKRSTNIKNNRPKKRSLASLAGKWTIKKDCSVGKYTSDVTINNHTSNRFSGNWKSRSFGNTGKLRGVRKYDGRVSITIASNDIFGKPSPQKWHGKLSFAKSGRVINMRGTTSDKFAKCTFVATKQ